jgi:polygalacturonase
MKKLRIIFPLIAFAVSLAGARAANIQDPVQYGAIPDGKTLCTAAIQKAMDECAVGGGGTVQLKAGTYLSGTIFFKSGVTLQLDEGATLLGSPSLDDYPETTPAYKSRMTSEGECVTQSLIYAERVEKIALRGKGQINGQGALFKSVEGGPQLKGRPFIIRMTECKDVLVEDITLRDSPSWMQDYLACDNLTIRGIKIDNHVRANNDSLDIDGCQNVHISDVKASSSDDGLCFKGTSLRPTRDVVVENCQFYSHCNSLKFGTDSQGGLENVQIRNVELGAPDPGKSRKNGVREGRAGIAWEVVDGGTLQNLTMDNIRIRGTRAPIFLRLGDRGRTLQGEKRLPPGKLRNVTISNVQAEGATDMGCPIAGIPGHPIENLTLRNIKISFAGGGLQEDTVRKFKERASRYPSADTWAKRLPAFGLYFWHVDGLTLENVQLTTLAPDERPAIMLETVTNVTIDGGKVEENHPPAGVSFLQKVEIPPKEPGK